MIYRRADGDQINHEAIQELLLVRRKVFLHKVTSLFRSSRKTLAALDKQSVVILEAYEAEKEVFLIFWIVTFILHLCKVFRNMAFVSADLSIKAETI